MLVLIFGIFLFSFIVLGITIFRIRQNNQYEEPSKTVKYVPKKFLTANELEFMGTLEAACNHLNLKVCPQVSMGALIDARWTNSSNRKSTYWQRGKFSQKIIDFVLINDRGFVVCLVELDDNTHDSLKDKERDALTAEAGYKTLRVKSTAKPAASDLSKLIRAVVNSKSN